MMICIPNYALQMEKEDDMVYLSLNWIVTGVMKINQEIKGCVYHKYINHLTLIVCKFGLAQNYADSPT